MSLIFRRLHKSQLALAAAFYFLLHACAIYMCGSTDGCITFYCGGKPFCRTQIPVSALPFSDAQAVSYGIYTPCRAGCTKMMEDFCA